MKCSMWDQQLQNLGLGLITINLGSTPTEGLLLRIRRFYTINNTCMLIIQGLFSGILLVCLNLLFIMVVQGPSYGNLLCFAVQGPLSWILLHQIIGNGKGQASKAPFWECVTIA